MQRVSCVSAQGTHTGPLATPMGEVPPTGKRLDMVGVTIATLDDRGLIKEEKRFYDTANVLRQLGLMPEPADVGTKHVSPHDFVLLTGGRSDK